MSNRSPAPVPERSEQTERTAPGGFGPDRVLEAPGQENGDVDVLAADGSPRLVGGERGEARRDSADSQPATPKWFEAVEFRVAWLVIGVVTTLVAAGIVFTFGFGLDAVHWTVSRVKPTEEAQIALVWFGVAVVIGNPIIAWVTPRWLGLVFAFFGTAAFDFLLVWLGIAEATEPLNRWLVVCLLVGLLGVSLAVKRRPKPDYSLPPTNSANG